MDYGKRRGVLLRTHEPTMGQIQLGKICRMMGTPHWAYVNNISAEMRSTQEYGVAPCVLELMKAWQVRWINYYDAEKNVTFGCSLEAMLRQAVGKRYSYRPFYYYLALSEWGRIIGRRRYDWVSKENVLALPWMGGTEGAPRGDEPQPVQARLF